MPNALVQAGSVSYAPVSQIARRRDRVVPVRASVRDKHYLTLKHKTCLWQQAVRFVTGLCTPSEFAVFTQIFDRSIGWGKPTCWATAIGLAEGHSGVFGGCGLSERTVKRCIASLSEKGIISKRGVRNAGTEFTIHLIWEEGEPMIAIPKRLREEGSNKGHRGPLATPKRDRVAHEYETEIPPLTSFGSEEPVYQPAAEQPGGEGTEEIVAGPEKEPVAPFRQKRSAIEGLIARTTERTEKAAAQRAARSKQKGNAHAFEVVWRHAEEMHFPDAGLKPSWTIAEKGIMKQIAQRWASNSKIVEFSEFLEWCVVNWPAVMRQQFRWMTKQKPPMTPSLRFWMKHHEGFLECYASGKLSKWMRAADRSRLEFLKARGKTHEEALYELAKEQALAETRKETDQKLAEVKRTEKRIVQEGQRIERMQQFGGAPAHPKSAAARRAAGQLQPVAPIDYDAPVDVDGLDATDIPGWED